MLRRMLQIKLKDHVPIHEMLKQANTKSVHTVIKSLKLGYVAREPELKLNSLLTFWVPRDRKRRRGIHTRWSDELVQVAGSNWKNKARVRLE